MHLSRDLDRRGMQSSACRQPQPSFKLHAEEANANLKGGHVGSFELPNLVGMRPREGRRRVKIQLTGRELVYPHEEPYQGPQGHAGQRAGGHGGEEEEEEGAEGIVSGLGVGASAVGNVPVSFVTSASHVCRVCVCVCVCVCLCVRAPRYSDILTCEC